MKTATKETDPKVSIVIPVYNGSDYLSSAIDSALSQTYKNTEIIVVNDGSNDNGETDRIAKSYGDLIKYVYKSNGGVASALNMGLDMMSGEYFSWLSHDDIYYPFKIQRQVEYLKSIGRDDVILFSNWEHIDADSKYLGNRIIEKHKIGKSIYVVMNCVINGCTLLIPKRCFDDVGTFDETLPTTQDYDLWFKMARKYEFAHMPDILVKYRIHPNQDSYRHPNHVKEQNMLHKGFNEQLTRDEILGLERSEAIFYIKRAIFYKNTFDEAEKYVYEQYKKHIQDASVLTKIIAYYYERKYNA